MNRPSVDVLRSRSVNSKRLKVEPIQQPMLFELEKPELAIHPLVERPFSLPGIFLGTSSFTASAWEGSVYPLGMRSKDYLPHYSSQFQTVEIDSKFYRTPSPSTVTGWNEKTLGDLLTES